jgi:hypothetical protein
MIFVAVVLNQKPDSFEKEAARIAAMLKQPDALGEKDLAINIDCSIDLGRFRWSSAITSEKKRAVQRRPLPQ